MKQDIMIGTWAWGTGYGGAKMVFGTKYDEEALIAAFRKATELGFLNWDTAAVYGMGTCESLLGRLIHDRDDIFISTKYFPSSRFQSGALEKSFSESMERLQRTSADLFWIHKPNNLLDNLKEAVPLIKEGRIRSIGTSNVSLDYCNSRGIRYYAYMVLEQGALAGRYDAQHHFPTFSMRNFAFPKSKFKKIEGLLSMMRDLAEKYEIDRSQIPILWAITKGAIPIVGITKPSYAEKLAAALTVSLSPEEVEVLTAEAKKTGIRQQGAWEPQ